MESNLGNVGAPWIDDSYDSPMVSTSIPDLLATEGTAIGTLIIIVVAAFFTIILLFIMAIFIDCRQQKVIKVKTMKTRKVLQLPRMARKLPDDQENFADKMHATDYTPSGIIVM